MEVDEDDVWEVCDGSEWIGCGVRGPCDEATASEAVIVKQL